MKLTLLIFSISLAVSSFNGISEVDVVDKGLKVDGVFIPTSFALKKGDVEKEGGYLLSEVPDVSNKHSIVKIISPHGQVEYWLVDIIRKISILIDKLPVEMKVTWYSADTFALVRSHMGVSTTIFYEFENVEKIWHSQALANVIYFEPKSNLTLQLSFDRNLNVLILVSNDLGISSESLAVDIKHLYMSDVLTSVRSVERQNCHVKIDYEYKKSQQSVGLDLPKTYCPD
jgi:hypothetical protein